MRYIIKKGTPVFEKLWAIQHQIQAAHAEARKLAIELKADPTYLLLSTGYAAGMVEGLHFAKRPGDWKLCHKEGTVQLYYPKDMFRNFYQRVRLRQLPSVERMAIDQLIGYQHQQDNPVRWQPFVGFSWNDDFILVRIPDKAIYTPINGVKSIGQAAYDALYVINNTTIPVHRWGKNDRILIKNE
ncbi:hypothetical protein [Larkinella rosea]|uniref:Uncharacterized protein n=1 Tax=Larkinella rosea TaxID=2025312 RepID=A0A3P1BYX1_9BACT|nr:hypothetical protein [Larkinella rosea]RRB06290.1 hypothetical protein EHT25_00345 [Larkinella rosea]